MKYLKYYISTLTLILGISTCFRGEYYPSIFFLCFSLFIILGDIILSEDKNETSYSYPLLLNLPMYINLFLLLGIVLMAVSALVDNPSHAFNSLILEYLHIDGSIFSHS